MATAFVSSLIAVALSVVLWIMGTIQGTTSLATDLGEFIGAYLDQVVQSDAEDRYAFYQPVENSHKDMCLFLTDYLDKFKKQVGESIEKAMKDKINDVFNSISDSATTYARYVSFIEESGSKLRDAGICFENASKTFASSSFATEFGDATDNFTGSLRLATDSSRQLILTATGLEAVLQSLQSSCDHAATYFYEMNEFAKTQNDLSTEIIELMKSSVEELSDSTKQLREARLAVGRDARANEQLVATTAQRLESVERSMKSMTDTLDQLIKSSKSSQKEVADAMLSMKNDFIVSTTAVNESVGERIMRLKDSIQQMTSFLEVAARDSKDSAKVIESVMNQASDSFQQSSTQISSTMRRLENDIDLRIAMANQNFQENQS
jgi:signal transduction histidine kinase